MAKKVSLPQLADCSQLLLSVSTGKADVTFTEPSLAIQFSANNPGTVSAINTDAPVRVFPNCWMFKRGQTEFKCMLNTVLDEVINGGGMDKLIRKYEPAPGALYSVAHSYQVPIQVDTASAGASM